MAVQWIRIITKNSGAHAYMCMCDYERGREEKEKDVCVHGEYAHVGSCRDPVRYTAPCLTALRQAFSLNQKVATSARLLVMESPGFAHLCPLMLWLVHTTMPSF